MFKQGILRSLSLGWKQERIPDQNGKLVETRVIDVRIDSRKVNNADSENDLKKLREDAKKLIKSELEKLKRTTRCT